MTTQEPLDARPDELAALQIFAARIGAELERRKQESRLREREGALIASRAKVLEAADEERKRIGRDLHDGPAAAHRARPVPRRRRPQARKRRRVGGAAAAADRPRAGHRGGRGAALARPRAAPGRARTRAEAALDTLAMQAPVALEVSALPDRRLPDVIEATIFYVVAEALSNAVKHARARVVRVAVSLSEAIVHATVADDGIGGVDPEGGTGLVGLRGRVEALSGTLAVTSPPGAGTTLLPGDAVAQRP